MLRGDIIHAGTGADPCARSGPRYGSKVTNAANLAFFMVNLSHRLLRELRRVNPHASGLDLKAYARGYRYAAEIMNLLTQKPTPGFWPLALQRLANLGRIHPAVSLPNIA